MSNYYDSLRLRPDATDKEINSAYRRLSLKYHPDKNLGDEQAERAFKEVAEAYEILSNTEKRAHYDRSLQPTSLESLFDAANKKCNPNSLRKGKNVKGSASVRLEDIALHDSTIRFSIEQPVSCLKCSGSGAEPGTGRTECSLCEGFGTTMQTLPESFMTVSQTCGNCRGSGKVLEKACTRCSGSRTEKIIKDLKVTIPAGIPEAHQVIIPNEGNLGVNGGPRGDIIIHIQSAPHSGFIRERSDLRCIVSIDFTQAILGDEIAIPTIAGRKIKLTIPPGTANNATLRVKGHGLRRYRQKVRGDMLVDVHIKIPEEITEKERKHLEEIRKIRKGLESSEHSTKNSE